MAVDYLALGDDIGAGHMTALFSALEGKVSEVLSGKSPFLLSVAADDLRPLLGQIYFFCNGTMPVLSAWGAQKYEHQIFLDALATMEAGTPDTAAGIIPLLQPTDPTFAERLGIYNTAVMILEKSLEAHTRGGLYVLEAEGANACPQKKYKWAVAEMVYEGLGFETVRIEQRWNKFNFFRFHNLNGQPMTVFFDGFPDFSVTIDAWSCATVRRTSVTEGYEKRWKYFWPFHSQDPRWYSWPNTTVTPGLVGGEQGSIRVRPVQSMSANNVINPASLYDWIAFFDRDIPGETTGIRFYRDLHAVYNIGTLYADKFGDASNLNTLIGDLLHHKGTLRLLSKDTGDTAYTVNDATFEGYANLSSLQGVTVEDLGGNLKLAGNLGTQENVLAGIGTNLVDGATTDSTSYTLKTSKPEVQPANVDGSKPAGAVWPIIEDSTTETFSWQTYELVSGHWDMFTTETVSGVIEETLLTTPRLKYVQVATNDNPVRLHKDTLQTILRLNHFGDDAYKFTDQDTDKAEFVNRSAALTITGLKLMFEQSWILEGSNVSDSGRLAHSNTQLHGVNFVFAFRPHEGERTGEAVMKTKGRISWDGYGFPAEGSRAPAIFTPRKNRNYRPAQYGKVLGVEHWGYPNAINDPSGANGADWGITLKGYGPPESTEATKLAALELRQPDWPQLTPVWQQPDHLYRLLKTNSESETSAEFYGTVPRFHLLTENYNDMAATVNSITGCFPLTYLLIPFDCGDDTFAYLAPNSIGIAGPSKARPLDQYGSMNDGDDLYRLCGKLGIPILTADDFPDIYGTLRADPGQGWQLKMSTLDSVITDSILSSEDLLEEGGSTVLGQIELHTVKREVTPGGKFEKTAVAAPGPNYYTYQRDGELFPDGRYQWCRIDDVKNAVQALDLRFLYRELCVPLELKRVETEPELLWSQKPTAPLQYGYTYYYFKQTNFAVSQDVVESSLSHYEGVYGRTVQRSVAATYETDEVLSDFIGPTTYDGAIWVYQQTEDAQFKKSPMDYVQLADYQPGNVLWYHRDGPSGYEGTTSPTPAGAPAFRQVFQFPLDAEVRAEIASCTQQQKLYHRKLAYIRNVSNGLGMDNDSAAVLCPVPWLGHETDQYSVDSLENAMRVVAGASVPIIAMEPIASTPAIELDDAGVTFIPVTLGSAQEPVFFLTDRVPLT